MQKNTLSRGNAKNGIKMRWLASAVLSLTLIIGSSFNAVAQNLNSSRMLAHYYYDYKFANPAFAGTKGKHVITTWYSGVPETSNHVLSAAYEQNIRSINTSIGSIVNHIEFGPQQYTHIGLLYTRQFALGKSNAIRVGGQAIYQRSTIDYDKYYNAIDPDDPLLPTGKSTTSGLNLDLGLLYTSDHFNVGAGLKNIADRDNQYRSLNFVVSRTFKLLDKLDATPSVFYDTDFEDNNVDLNATFKVVDWILFGANYRFPQGGEGDLNMNVGLNIKDWVQIVTHFYAYQNARQNDDPLVETLIRVTIPEGPGE